VSDPLGSWAAVAIRFGIHPTIVTIANLGLALAASIFVITQADQLHPGWMPGLLALVLWQLSYILDCADGQVARATGKASLFGESRRSGRLLRPRGSYLCACHCPHSAGRSAGRVARRMRGVVAI
jgi:hypothetical protein